MNHDDHTILRVLSIQSDILGNRTYCESMRHYFAQFKDVDLNACWYHDGRTFADRAINKLAQLSLPCCAVIAISGERAPSGQWDGWVLGRRKGSWRNGVTTFFTSIPRCTRSEPLT